jgi:hypothetical protein
MRNIIVILALCLSTLIFGQKSSDKINLDSINNDLLNELLIKKIIEQRYLSGATEIMKDTIPMASAKYHTDYFVTYDDTSSTHNPNNPLPFYYLGNSTPYPTNFSTPQSRLFNVGVFMNQVDQNKSVELIKEVTFFSPINNFSQINYTECVEKIFNNLIDNNKKDILYDYTNEERFIGVSSVTKDHNFMLTLVISTKISK